jgi:uncharacterized protein (DUF1810 family)
MVMPENLSDPFELNRFVEAQEDVYETALR